MKIYEFDDYREFFKQYYALKLRNRRGYISAIAKILRVHTTFVSLVFRGLREFNLEHGAILASHLKLSVAETEFLLNLIIQRKSGNHLLTNFATAKIKNAQNSARAQEKKLDFGLDLSNEERSVFYSSWHYSAIHLFIASSKNGKELGEIIEYFNLSQVTLESALVFLLSTKLIVQSGNVYLAGADRISIGKEHPVLKSHLTNWRLKALQGFEQLSKDEIMLTTTMAISKSDFEALKALLLELVSKTSSAGEKTDSEQVACLNLDLFVIK